VNFEHLKNQKEQKIEKKDSAPAYVFENHHKSVCDEDGGPRCLDSRMGG
jgi:lipopolysaccharide export system protein LptC